MADDKFSGSRDESDESTPKDPADSPREPAELTDSDDITDVRASSDDEYADDPATTDINEAKLDRATDEVAEDADTGRPARRAGRARTTAPVRRTHSRGRADAESGDRQRSGRATTPAKFVAESIGELRKVVWPTGTQLQQYFVVVLVFVLFIMTVVSLLDLGFGWVILKVFG